MLNQIVTHTPLYVWGILAFLVYRGVVALRERETTIRKIFTIPVVMLALSLQDIVAKFGSGLLPLAAWAGAVVLVTLLVYKFSSVGISVGAAPDGVRVHGSWAPLAMMMAIFMIKYATAVTLAIAPNARHDALFSTAVCVVFGVFNGFFLGRLAHNLASWQRLRAQARTGRALPAAA